VTDVDGVKVPYKFPFVPDWRVLPPGAFIGVSAKPGIAKDYNVVCAYFYASGILVINFEHCSSRDNLLFLLYLLCLVPGPLEAPIFYSR